MTFEAAINETQDVGLSLFGVAPASTDGVNDVPTDMDAGVVVSGNLASDAVTDQDEVVLKEE